MNTGRILILGALDQWGPQHGHEILKLCVQSNADLWSTIRSGSVYGLLSRMQDDDFVRPLRTEREGRFPERTIYEITERGRNELAALIKSALHWVPKTSSDPFDAALTAISTKQTEELKSAVQHRQAELVSQLESISAGERSLRGTPNTPLIAVAIVRHMIHRLRAEIAWLHEFEAMLPDIFVDLKRLEKFREELWSSIRDRADKNTITWGRQNFERHAEKELDSASESATNDTARHTSGAG